MAKNKKNKTITYPLRIGLDLYDMVKEAAELNPVKPSKAAIMRQALEIGLNVLMESK